MSVTGLVDSLFGQEGGERTQGGEDSCAVWLPDLAAVLVIGSVPHVMVAVFDPPLAPSDFQELLRIAQRILLGGEAGNGQDVFLAGLLAAEVEEVSVDSHHLVCPAEANLLGIDLQSPDRAGLESSVMFLDRFGLAGKFRGGKRPSEGVLLSPARRVGCPSRRRNTHLPSPAR